MAEEGGSLFGPKKSAQDGSLGFNFPGGSFAFILFLILILLFFGDN
ncbi:MAG: hypothetical protein PWR22_1392 [Moorella sp. (in: firmicutes)]|jgi:hypothetical protein|nr:MULTISPECIES: hypothetical protein [unclassified Moorella (in: firmicutes)]MDK2816763.1 hypothetical protein [Moorella sp. (in: firmicutes)]MDK2893991.1 hypothetical protein [Moorella sp. (in: firmicutes)]GEA15654.1 hypothetical protein E308F_18980 [Moorella sp. E308F]GEA19488.1 hypothetical protein E306M_26260 [Moorella sp. E306M]